jgi:hypothetical protein
VLLVRWFIFVKRSSIPARIGRLVVGRPFAAQTVGPVIFIPGRLVAPSVLKHELVHVTQWYLGTAIAAVLWLIFTPSPWLLLLCPLAFSIAYGIASLVAFLSGEHPYRGNWFEKQARRRAGELV